MRKRSRSAIAALVVVGCLAAAVSNANAGRLEFNESFFTFKWTDFRLRDTNSGLEVRCKVTLNGLMASRTFLKTEVRIGQITESTINECTGGTATLLPETRPWRVNYGGFSGTLPSLSAIIIEVVGMGIGLRPSLGALCLGTSTAERPAVFRLNRVAETGIENIRALPEHAIPTTGIGCGMSDTVTLSGQGEVSVLGAATRWRIRLI